MELSGYFTGPSTIVRQSGFLRFRHHIGGISAWGPLAESITKGKGDKWIAPLLIEISAQLINIIPTGNRPLLSCF